jgi:hypothetical protein
VKFGIILAVLVALWAIAVAGRILWQGDVYGLNYRTLHGDGACYSVMAFDFAGDPVGGRRQIVDAYAAADIPIIDLNSDAPCLNYRLQSRVLYPLLSIPFVKVLGLNGMLVVPALSWLAAVVVPAILLMRRGYFLGALAAGSLAIVSTSVARWSVADITDALLMGLAALMLLVLPLTGKPIGRWRLAGFGLLIVMAALTRQSWPFWIALVVTPWIACGFIRRKDPARPRNAWRNEWLPVVLVGVPVTLVSYLGVSLVLGEQNGPYVLNTVKGAIVAAPIPVTAETVTTTPGPAETVTTTPGPAETVTTTPGPAETTSTVPVPAETVKPPLLETLKFAVSMMQAVLVVEAGQLLVLDRGLVLLLVLALLSSWLSRRWSASYAFLGVLFSTVFLGAVNSTVGVNFRFQLPVVPFAVLMAGVLIARAKPVVDTYRRKAQE